MMIGTQKDAVHLYRKVTVTIPTLPNGVWNCTPPTQTAVEAAPGNTSVVTVRDSSSGTKSLGADPHSNDLLPAFS